MTYEEMEKRAEKMTQNKIDFLVEALQPEEGETVTAKYYIAGYFNTGEHWINEFNNRQELVYTVRRLYQNEAVNHPWVITEAQTGVKLWDSENGFTEAKHPKYMELAI